MAKTVMILGAGVLQIPLIERALERGFQTVVVSPVPSEPGHAIATHSEICDVVDEAGVLELARKYNIDGIITDQTDLPVRTVSYVANKLGLPGIDYDVACLFTDKYLMRERCRELGIRTLRYSLCHSLDEVVAFYESIGGDIILKPVDNQGSKGVYRISSKRDIHDKFGDAFGYSRSGRVLAEEFVTGREFLVEGICFDYEYRNLCCGDTLYFDIPDVFSACRREFPSVAPRALARKVLETNAAIVKGFGLKQGITHGEYIIDGDDVILIEIAARGGGVFISSDLIALQTGMRTEDYLLDIALGTAKGFPDIARQGRSCCYVSFFLPEGEITALEGVERVQSLPYTYHNNLDSLWVGKSIQQARDKTGRFFIIVAASDHGQLMERIKRIRQMLRVYMNGDGQRNAIIWG